MNYNFKYNYVVFSWLMPNAKSIEDDYYAISLRDLDNREDVILNFSPLQGRSSFMRLLWRISMSRLCNNRWWKFNTSFWYPFIFKNTFKDNKPICFVCIRFPEANYLSYLHKHYPHCKVVVMCRDLLRVHMDAYLKYQRGTGKVYDYWMSYDKAECEKYGFRHFEQFESKIHIPISNEYPIADVFFAGRAKDRLSRLVAMYDELTRQGMKCLFLIMSASEEIRVTRDGIRYIDDPITYSEMLRLTVNSKCLLDLNQSDCVGYTPRILEAIIYNKKLITDNASILNTKYYNPLHMQYIKTADDIDARFINDNPDVDYHYNNDFSPLNILLQIDKMLSSEVFNK